MPRSLVPAMVACLIASLVAVEPSLATTTLTYVASYGDDESTCTLALPCRTLTRALSQTSSGGEITILDAGDYDAVSVTQSVSILAAPGVQASIVYSSGYGVHVNGSGIKVILRGVSIRAVGGDYGIYFQAGSSLHVENCEVTGTSGRALNMTATSAKMFVTDTVFRNNGGGPTVDASASAAQAIFVRVYSLNNTGRGFNIEAGKVTLRDVVAASNGSYGIGAIDATVDIERATARGNYSGIAIGGSGTKGTIITSTVNQNANDGVLVTDGAVVIASGNVITWNVSGVGLYIAGGTFKSTGDNIISDNATNVSGSITSLAKQ